LAENIMHIGSIGDFRSVVRMPTPTDS